MSFWAALIPSNAQIGYS